MGISKLERYRGCLLGLAAGDAVGTAVEFRDYRNGVCGEIIGSSPVGFLPQQRLSRWLFAGGEFRE